MKLVGRHLAFVRESFVFGKVAHQIDHRRNIRFPHAANTRIHVMTPFELRSPGPPPVAGGARSATLTCAD
jgi:hypothetical protein